MELARLVRYYMQINGNFDLTVVFTGVAIPTALRWLASFELKLIFFRNTFCHHRSPFAEHKSVIFYRGHHSN